MQVQNWQDRAWTRIIQQDLQFALTVGAFAVAGLEAAAQKFAPLVPAQLILQMIPKLRANPGVQVAWTLKN